MSAHSAPGPPDTGAGPGIPRYRAAGPRFR